MRLLPAAAAVITAALAVISVIRGDWGVVVVSAVLCAVATRAFILSGRNRQPPLDAPDES